MGQQELRTVISIGGNVDSSFGRIGSALLGLGSVVDELSQKTIEFGKDSLENFVNYDDLMREVKAVGEFSNSEISTLDKLNKKIAQTSTYSNEQAAQAEVLLGQLGLVPQQIATLMPNVLNLAMAGNLDLADSVSYLYAVLKGTGTEINNSDTLVDQMAKTAAIGATDIDTLGDSMTRLGSGMMLFKGGAPEVMTILSELSQFGEDMRGTQGGTMLRNFALSLIAPMGQTKQVLAALEHMDMTPDDLAEYFDEEGIEATSAAAAIKELGVDVFDSNGQLRDMLDILPELRTALGKMDDSRRIPILRQIFGKRGYVTAENLLKVSDSEYTTTLNEILNSDGFAEQMKDTMQGGIGGALRELSAAYEQFKTTVGGAAAPTIEQGADWLHGIVIDMDNMDPKALKGLVTGIGAISAAGPALLGAGLFFRVLGYVFTPAGAVTLGLGALAAAVYALQQMDSQSLADNFGTMSLDSEKLNAYVTDLGNGFKSAHTNIDSFKTSLDNAVTGYQTASSELSEKILTGMLTKTKFSDADKAAIISLGMDMGNNLLAGINAGTAGDMTIIEDAFGGEGVAENNPFYQDIIGAQASAYDEAVANADKLGSGLRSMLINALADDVITDDEYAKIKEFIKSYNQAMTDAAAELANEKFQTDLEAKLYKAQTGSLEDYQTYSNDLKTMFNTAISDAENEFAYAYADAKIDMDKQVSNGKMTQEQENQNLAALAETEGNYVYKNNGVKESIDAIVRLWNTALSESDLSGAFNEYKAQADSYLNGDSSWGNMLYLLNEKYGKDGSLWQPSTSTSMAKMLNQYVQALGGNDQVQQMIGYYRKAGDTGTANELLKILTLSSLGTDVAWKSSSNTDFYPSDFVESNRNGNPADQNPEYSNDLFGTMKRFIDNAEISIFGGKAETQTHEAPTTGGVNLEVGNLDISGFSQSIQDYMDANPTNWGKEQSTTSTNLPNGILETSAFSQTAQNLFGLNTDNLGEVQKTIDANPLSVGINLPDGNQEANNFRQIAQAVLDANPGSWAVQILRTGSLLPAGKGGKTGTTGGTGSIFGFAEGGRADEPSIFGEAGAEWAIPEEHNEKTAALLDDARKASGFTWPELISRNGGLNANPGNKQIQIFYSPTIHAEDARGVEQILLEDKDRFEKWMKDKQLRDEAEVYS